MTDGEVADREAIRLLMARYNAHGDRGRLEALAATFAEEGEFSGTASRGRAGILARLGAPGARDPRLTVTRHHLTTSLVEIDGDRATGRTYFQVWTEIGLDHHGVYVDAMVKQAGGWLFLVREVRIDWQAVDSLYPALDVRGVALRGN